MQESKIHLHPTGPLFALVGNPNCGKTALFNQLTGSRQKVANYAGVTVERKEGRFQTPTGVNVRVLDLPGTYSLYPRSIDEQITCNVLMGRATGEKTPDVVICVVDATNLRRSLRIVLAVERLGLPCMVALNMVDEAHTRGIKIDTGKLSQALGLPVIATVAIQKGGDDALREAIDQAMINRKIPSLSTQTHTPTAVENDHQRIQEILRVLSLDHVVPDLRSEHIDQVILNPVAGPIILVAILFSIFQAMFSLAEIPMAFIIGATEQVGDFITTWLPDIWLRSLLIDGIIAGVGGVVVFLPQILILFFFILVLEESGYLPRAAFLLDRLMGSVGLSGRSFIPLLSSFACAIPGIIAARTIPNVRDRMVTILIAPLMTCSARLPVYVLLISAFIPSQLVWGSLELQGLVMFGLYFAGIFGAMAVAWFLKMFTSKNARVRPLMMELPTYRWPRLKNLAIGLWQRAALFLKRVGGIIMIMTIALWFLASFPGAPEGAVGPAIEYSFAGMMGHALAFILEPIGFNWQIAIALVPGMAAREVAVSALGTVYALSATGDAAAESLIPIISAQWSLATGMSLLAWYVFAPQCLSTIATMKRESGGWKIPLIGLAYMFLLAYGFAWVTFNLVNHWFG
jgi:ferrous iron transport protein B